MHYSLFIYLLSITGYLSLYPDIKIVWLNTPDTTATAQVEVQWAIKSSEQIVDLDLSVNGVRTQGTRTVHNDGYDLKSSRAITLQKGNNTVELFVRTASGKKARSAHYIVYKEKDVVDDRKNIADDKKDVAVNKKDVTNNKNFKLKYKKNSSQGIEKDAYDGNAEAQYIMGENCLNGNQNGTPDLAKANEWFSKAAAQGHAGAQYEYAISLLTGRGTPIDKPKAIEYLKCAAKQNFAPAIRKLNSLTNND